MEKTKLTIRIDRELLEGAKRYARKHETSLTRLVSEYLRRLSVQDDLLSDDPDHLLLDAPIVRRLSGILSQDATVDDYRDYLERKYGG